MSFEVKFYHKQNCRKCDFINKRLKVLASKGLDFKLDNIFVDVDKDTSTMKYLSDNGYKSFPVVQLWNDSDMVDSFCDVDIKGLNRIKEKISEERK